MSLINTVGELVVERPSRARVFERFGIDYCCGGKMSLQQACQKQGIDPQAVLAALEQVSESPETDVRDWSTATLSELADHVEATHHAYLKREFPRLEFLTGRVAERHGDVRPELRKLHEVFLAFKSDLEAHMAKEEKVLFPMCRQLGNAVSAPEFHCGSVSNPVAVMVREHDHAGEDLRQMRKLTGGYVPPEDACNTYRAMLSGLADLEADMHQHVHFENHVLFPKAIAAESPLTACGA